jgi:hypothetical protein
MRETTLAILLLLLSACTGGRASGRRAGEIDTVRGDRPYLWSASGEDASIDAANAAIQVGWAGIVAATSEEPPVPLCGGSQPGDPPHTCPAKAADEH